MRPCTRIGIALVAWSYLAAPALVAQGRSTAGRPPAAKTEVVITDLRRVRDADFQVRVMTSPTAGELQLLVFMQDLKSGRFSLAFDLLGKSQPPGFPIVANSSQAGLEWNSRFSSAWGHPSIRVFAVACLVGPQARQNRDAEFESLRHLPYDGAPTIEDILVMLSDFRWRPVGYTVLDAQY
jgi:hypothetical protein